MYDLRPVRSLAVCLPQALSSAQTFRITAAEKKLTRSNDSKQEPTPTIVADTSEPQADTRGSNFPQHTEKRSGEQTPVVRTPLPEVSAPHAETPSRG